MSAASVALSGPKIAVIVPAAGVGERAGAAAGGVPPKQFADILGVPLLQHTISALLAAAGGTGSSGHGRRRGSNTDSFKISRIVLIVSKSQMARATLLLTTLNTPSGVSIDLIAGGPSRHRSIAEGVRHLRGGNNEPDIVIVHDAVRPQVRESHITRVVRAAIFHGSAGLVTPLTSTVVKRHPGTGTMIESLPRDEDSPWMASQTPQAFKFDILSAAYKFASDEDLDHGTECLELAKRYAGAKPHLVTNEGEDEETLWKVTYPHDLLAADGILRAEREAHLITKTYEDTQVEEEFLSTLFALVQDRFRHVRMYGADTLEHTANGFLRRSSTNGKSVTAAATAGDLSPGRACLIVHFAAAWQDIFIGDALSLSESYRDTLHLMITSEPIGPDSVAEIRTLISEISTSTINVTFIHSLAVDLPRNQDRLARCACSLLWSGCDHLRGQILFF